MLLLRLLVSGWFGLYQVWAGEEEFTLSGIEIFVDNNAVANSNQEIIPISEGSTLKVNFTLKYPSVPRKCQKCHLYPPTQVSLILERQDEHRVYLNQHDSHEECQERIVWFKRVNGSNGTDGQDWGGDWERYTASLGIDNERHYYPSQLLHSGIHQLFITIGTLNPSIPSLHQPISTLNLSMSKTDSSQFKHYITGYPLQEFHHAQLPEIYRAREGMDDKPKAEDVSDRLVVAMTVVTLIPAWAWLIYALPKRYYNPSPRPTLDLQFTLFPFMFTLITLLWVFIYLFWYQSWRVGPILKISLALAALALILGRRVALAMVKRRMTVEIWALPEKRKVN